MTMIISSYTSIHPFLGAYIIHSVYDKPISLQDQTLFTTIYKHTFSGQNTLYVDSIGFMRELLIFSYNLQILVLVGAN